MKSASNELKKEEARSKQEKGYEAGIEVGLRSWVKNPAVAGQVMTNFITTKPNRHLNPSLFCQEVMKGGRGKDGGT